MYGLVGWVGWLINYPETFYQVYSYLAIGMIWGWLILRSGFNMALGWGR